MIVNESVTLASPVNFNDLSIALIIPSSGINLVAIEWSESESKISTFDVLEESITNLYSSSITGGVISP